MAAVCNTTWRMMVQCTRYCLWSKARAGEGAGFFHWVNCETLYLLNSCDTRVSSLLGKN